MARRVVFRPQAEDEVLEVRQWYEAKRSGLGQEFGQQLDALMARIAERPLAFPRVHHETRRAVLPRVPDGAPKINVEFVKMHDAEIATVLASLGIRD